MATIKSTKTFTYLAEFLANNFKVYSELKGKIEKVSLNFDKHLIPVGRSYVTLNVRFVIKEEVIPKGDTFITIDTPHYNELEVYVGKDMDWLQKHNRMIEVNSDFYNVLVFFKKMMEDVKFEIKNNDALEEGTINEMNKIIR